MNKGGNAEKETVTAKVANEDLAVQALFLGPKSENRDYFLKTLDFLIREHLFWRRDFHPEDKDITDPKDMRVRASLRPWIAQRRSSWNSPPG